MTGNQGLCRFVLFILLTSLSFLSEGLFSDGASADDTISPYVVSTNPADGATGVDVNIRSVSVVFSEPMSAACSYSSSDFWGIGGPTWSADGRTLTIQNYSSG